MRRRGEDSWPCSPWPSQPRDGKKSVIIQYTTRGTKRIGAGVDREMIIRVYLKDLLLDSQDGVDAGVDFSFKGGCWTSKYVFTWVKRKWEKRKVELRFPMSSLSTKGNPRRVRNDDVVHRDGSATTMMSKNPFAAERPYRSQETLSKRR